MNAQEKKKTPSELVSKNKLTNWMIDEYLNSLDNLQTDMQKLMDSILLTRKVTWKAANFNTKQKIESIIKKGN